jgi:hypothetical protein
MEFNGFVWFGKEGGGAGVPRILENRWNSLDLLAFERGWGGRMTPESLEIHGILWICMVSEGCGGAPESLKIIRILRLCNVLELAWGGGPSKTMQIHRIG